MFASVFESWWNKGKVEKKSDNKTEKRLDEDGLEIEEEEEAEMDDESIEIRRRFHAASTFLPSVTDRLDRQTLLELYALFKTATAGLPEASDRPGVFDQKGRAKFDAWTRAAGQYGKRQAMRAYADALEDADVGFDADAVPSTSSGAGGGGFGIRISRPRGDHADGADPAAAEPQTPDAMEYALWLAACRADDASACARLLEGNPRLDTKRDEETGMTALHWAADANCPAVVHLLLERAVPLNERDDEGNTALHLACLCEHEAVVRLLVDAGADADARNDDGERPADVTRARAIRALLG